MAWLVDVPPSPRHPKPRWQVCYQDGKRQRSAGIYPTLKAANPGKAETLFGDYVTETWWPIWRDYLTLLSMWCVASGHD